MPGLYPILGLQMTWKTNFNWANQRNAKTSCGVLA
jgi:hypothetical protein